MKHSLLVTVLAAGVVVGSAVGARAAEASRPAGGMRNERLITTLRGTLSAPTADQATNALAVLHFRIQGRKPCLLQANDADLAAKLRDLAAQGAVVTVAGQPGPVAFAVLTIREEGRRSSPATNDAAAVSGILSGFHWGSVPEQGNR